MNEKCYNTDMNNELARFSFPVHSTSSKHGRECTVQNVKDTTAELN
jgi:hypothetical protein